MINPLFLQPLSPLVPRGERESSLAMVVVGRYTRQQVVHNCPTGRTRM